MGQYCFACWRLSVGVCRRRLSSSATLYGGPADGFSRTGQAMTSCRHYSSTVTLHGGPVRLRPVTDTVF